MERADLLRVEGLQVSIDLHRSMMQVVSDVSFRVPAGKTVAIVGESGSGKSITAQAILGILPQVASVTGGRILFRDPKKPEKQIDIAELEPGSTGMQDLRGGRISMIFQEPMTSLSPLHKIGNQVEEALRLHGRFESGSARRITEKMLRRVGFPEPSRAYDMYPMELSGGLRQRAMIAMALICQPALLIADEPTTALDVTVQAQVLGLLKNLQRQLHMSLLLITHDLGVVANMADEVVVMHQGEVVEAGPVEDIFRRPGHAYTKALMRAVPTLSMGPNEKLVPLREHEHVIPASMCKKPVAAIIGGKPLLCVRHLSKGFNIRKEGWLLGHQSKVMAVKDVSFDVFTGECLGIVGESGCGKTTVSKLIMRALSADTGQIRFDNGELGCEVTELAGKELKEFRKRIQIVFQDPFASLSPRSTVLNILSEPLEIHGIGTPVSIKKNAAELMGLVGLQPSYLNRYPHSFSGGQRQRIGIARALALSPDLLICDEPVSALDVSVQAQILNLLKKLQAELGLTLIFISHNLAVVKYLANRIAVMRRGRIVEIAPTAALFGDPVHPYTRALLNAVPHADLDHKLDFTRQIDETRDETEGWGAIFKSDDPADLTLHSVAEGHFVLSRAPVGERLSA